jgi:Kef-type K+ transport system membrane component KefB
MPSLSESQILHFLVQLLLLIVTARALADLFKRFGQATVIGELLSGILLGTSILGRFAPHVYHLIFPPDPVSADLIEAFAWVGMIMLLMNTGIETDLGILSGLGRPAMLVSGLGVAVPLLGGYAVGSYLPAALLVHPDQPLIFAFFLAVAMAISAVPVIARILIDLDIMRRELGLVILAAGVIDDLVGWLLLSVIAGLAARAHIELRGVGLTLLATIAFIGFAYFVGFRLISYILRWVDDRSLVDGAPVTAIIALTFFCAIVTQAIGVHAVFGAFVGGLMIGRSPRLRKTDREAVASLTESFLAPVFFAYSGLQADILALQGL